MGSYQQLPQPNVSYGQPWKPQAFDPNQGQKYNYYGAQIGAQGDPSLSYQPDLDTSDPQRIFRNSATVGYNLGAGIDASTYQQQQQQAGLYDAYGTEMNNAYGALATTPGYTDAEAGAITRNEQYNALATTPEQYASLGPTGAESAGMTGNVGSYANSFNPQAINDAVANSASMTRNGVDLAEAGVNSAVGKQQAAYNQAIDPNKLDVSGQYGKQQSDVLNVTADRLDAAHGAAGSSLSKATGNPGLNTTAEYARQAGMTDAEVQQQADAGARDVGLRYQGQMDDAARRASAGGNTSALAVGAQQARLAQQSATGSADARTNAQLAARSAQRGAATGVQQTQLGAAQYKTGAEMGAAEYLGQQGSQNAQYEGNLAQNATQQMEQTRLGAEQYKTGAQMQAASGVANSALQGAEWVGSARTGNEANIGQNTMAGQQYNQQTGTGIAMAQDQTAAGRAAQLYSVRQGNTQYGQQSTYQQGMGIQGAQSQSAANVANARRGGQQEYRGWTGQQQGQALQGQQQATGQRIQNYGTMSGAMNQNASANANYNLGADQNSFGGTLKRNVAKSLGTFSGSYSGGGGG